jgi:hypothetical protein
MSNVPKTIDQLLNDYAQAWRGDGNGTTAEAFPSPDSQRIRALETLILARTNLCPFGGGNVEGERAACKFGHPGCVCADVAAGKS